MYQILPSTLLIFPLLFAAPYPTHTRVPACASFYAFSFAFVSVFTSAAVPVPIPAPSLAPFPTPTPPFFPAPVFSCSAFCVCSSYSYAYAITGSYTMLISKSSLIPVLQASCTFQCLPLAHCS